LITTLQRLRRLLGDTDAVAFENGRLSLHHELWVDAQAVEAGLHGDDPRLLERALGLYHGPFLVEEGEASWLLAPRDRLHDAVLQGYQCLGAQWRSQGRWEALITLYHRALAVDDLHEPFYREPIRAHARLGRTTEALRLYHRCRRRFQAELGVSPSPATQALLAELLS